MQTRAITTLADLGSAVKQARKGLALTQAEAAALCGVSMPFLNQLEGAKRLHLSVTKVLAVCAGLGVTLFTGGAGVRAVVRPDARGEPISSASSDLETRRPPSPRRKSRAGSSGPDG